METITELEFDARIQQYKNRKDISEPERNTALVMLRAAKASCNGSTGDLKLKQIATTVSALVMHVTQMDDRQRSKSSIWGIKISRDGIVANGLPAVIIAVLIAYGAAQWFNQKNTNEKIEQLSAIVEKVAE